MLRGSIEVVEFVPRQVTVDPLPVTPVRVSDDIRGRLRLGHRTVSSFLAASASLALHAILVAPTLWVSAAPQHSPRQKQAGETTLKWIVLDDAPKPAFASVNLAPLSSPALVAIGLSDLVPALPAASPDLDTSRHKDAEDHSSLGEMSGRYVGQIQARIERAWLRPRTAIGAPIFQCQVQVDQDGAGRVGEVTLLTCNGDDRWRLSLVRAITAASPLPAAPDPKVFARHVVLQFRAMAYSPAAEAGLYEPAIARTARATRDEADESRHTFQTLRDAATAPNVHRVIQLRIEGSKAEVVPEH